MQMQVGDTDRCTQQAGTLRKLRGDGGQLRAPRPPTSPSLPPSQTPEISACLYSLGEDRLLKAELLDSSLSLTPSSLSVPTGQLLVRVLCSLCFPAPQFAFQRT